MCCNSAEYFLLFHNNTQKEEKQSPVKSVMIIIRGFLFGNVFFFIKLTTGKCSVL